MTRRAAGIAPTPGPRQLSWVPMRSHPSLRFVSLALLAAAATACDEGSGCDDPVEFSVLPVDLASVPFVTPIGGLGPPGHTLPTDHVGFYLTGTGITLRSPSDMTIREVRRTTYLASPFRQGQSDYSVTGALCQDQELIIGHIQTVVAGIEAAVSTSDCETYSTADETVQSCRSETNMALTAGATIGTVGGPSAGAFDWGLHDPRHTNFFVNPDRYAPPVLDAVCPYDPFISPMKEQLYDLIGDGLRTASGESPQCGSMSVDVAGTASGAWVLQSDPVIQAGDETNFAVLAPHPLFPQSQQAFSLGPTTLFATSGAGNDTYPLETSGRVNRRFSDVPTDGLLYCYVYDASVAAWSYFVRLAAGPVLTIEKVTHAAGATPCGADPSTWSFSGAALAFIR